MRQPWLIILFDLFLMQLTNLRWAWHWILIGGLVIPLTFMFLFSSMLEPHNDEALLYIVTGNAVISLLFGTMSQTTTRFAFMRETDMLHYFSVLPIPKLVLILATVWSFLFLALPGVLITLIVGKIVLGLSIVFHPLALVIALLGGTVLASLGAMIGSKLPNQQLSGATAQFLTFFMMVASPILISQDLLIWPLRLISYALPSTYVAHGFRETLSNQVTPQVFVDIAVLGIFSLVLLFLVNRHLDWRD